MKKKSYNSESFEEFHKELERRQKNALQAIKDTGAMIDESHSREPKPNLTKEEQEELKKALIMNFTVSNNYKSFKIRSQDDES